MDKGEFALFWTMMHLFPREFEISDQDIKKLASCRNLTSNMAQVFNEALLSCHHDGNSTSTLEGYRRDRSIRDLVRPLFFWRSKQYQKLPTSEPFNE